MEPRPDFGLNSYKGSGKLKDKVAIVTGGDSGIGRAVALAYAREGAHVIISYLNEHEDAEEIKKHVEAEGVGCLLIPGDIQEDSHCKKIIEDTIQRFNKIDILVNNAASMAKAVEEMDELTYDRVLATFKTNIVSMFSLVRYALPHIKPGGAIINVASDQAYQPRFMLLDYASSKAAIVAFSKALSQKTITKGIRTNCVAPGPVWTPLNLSCYTADFNAKCGGDMVGYERPAQPAELAPGFVYLASSDSSYTNGTVLGVTGGIYTM